MEIIQHIDDWFFSQINGLAGQSPWLDTPARLFMNDYFVATLMAIILLALWFESTRIMVRINNQRAVLVGALSALLANIVVKTINLFYFHPRPFHRLEVNLLFYQPHDSSLPSNAAALGFSIAAGVWFYQQKWGWLLLTIAALFAMSRIFGGVHTPLDVLCGVAVGVGSACVVKQQKFFTATLLDITLKLNAKLRLP